MGVKISELPVASSANNSDSLVLNHGSETQRITLEKLMEGGKRVAGLVTDSELQTYLENYVTQDDLDNSGYMSEADVESVLSETIGDYLSDYVTRSDLENDGYLTESELSDYYDGTLKVDGEDVFVMNIQAIIEKVGKEIAAA